MDVFAETKKHLRKVAPQTWQLTSTHVLYLSDAQATAYSSTKSNARYNSFHDAAVTIIREQVADICAAFNRGARVLPFVDLGPEYPDKTLPILEHMSGLGRPMPYVPVDINPAYLKLAQDAAGPVAGSIGGLCATFEDYASRTDVLRPALAFIGLTFMNMPARQGLDLLAKIAGKRGYVGIASELVTRANTPDRILARYATDQIRALTAATAGNLGIGENALTHDPQFNHGRVEMAVIVDKDQPHLGMRAGDRLICGVSHRYTHAQLQHEMLRRFGRTDLFLAHDAATAVAISPVP